MYLRKYKVREFYESNKKTVYRFGRIEDALSKMHYWKRNFELFPKQLKTYGCTYDDLCSWIDTLESGKHKSSGRRFDPVI